MRIGIVVPQGWVLEYTGWDGPSAWERTVAVTRQAEQLGFESVWMYDHVHHWPQPADEVVFEPFVALTALSALTQRVRIGHIVICTGFRNPALTAKMMATLDVISDGRAELGEERVRDAVKTIGLFRNKAKNVIELSRLLIERHGGTVPQEREALEALPGVGRKTANVVLNEAFGVPTIAVDTHIFRVANRTGIAPGKNVNEVEQRLLRLVPKEFLHDAHHWLILLGRYTCVARKPRCNACLIRDLCPYEDKTP